MAKDVPSFSDEPEAAAEFVSFGELIGDEDAGETAPASEEPPGDELTVKDLPDPEPFVVAEPEAEELAGATPTVDLEESLKNPVEVDDPEQLAEAEKVAQAATSTRPTRKNQGLKKPAAQGSAPAAAPAAQPEAEAKSVAKMAESQRPTRKAAATTAEVAESQRPTKKPAVTATAEAARKNRPTRSRAEATAVEGPAKTTPAKFVGQSVQELKKVQWPTGAELRQYFTVVLIFVLFIIAFVFVLDLGLGWVVLHLFGSR